jgi:hypothetical protein
MNTFLSDQYEEVRKDMAARPGGAPNESHEAMFFFGAIVALHAVGQGMPVNEMMAEISGRKAMIFASVMSKDAVSGKKL